MAACVVDGIELDDLAQVIDAAAAHDGDGAVPGELGYGSTHVVRKKCLRVVIDDGRERAVVVKEHCQGPS